MSQHWKTFAFVPVESAAAAEAAIAPYLSGPGEPIFAIPLGPAATGPVTHLGCSPPVGAETLAALPALAAALGGAYYPPVPSTEDWPMEEVLAWIESIHGLIIVQEG